MNERQRRFCEYYAASGNATQAARDAGFSARTAHVQASRLLRNDKVLKYIRDLQEQSADSRIVSMKVVKAFWCDILTDATQRTADRLKASELLAKSAGEFIHLGHDDGGSGVLRGQHNGEDVVIVLPDNGRDPEMRGKFLSESELEDYLEAQKWPSDR